MMEICTVEQIDGVWWVVTEEGEPICRFKSQQEAEDWLVFKQEEAEMNALASYTMDG